MAERWRIRDEQQRRADVAEGKATQLLVELEKQHGLSSLEQAKERLVELEKVIDKKLRKAERLQAEVDEKYGSKLKQGDDDGIN